MAVMSRLDALALSNVKLGTVHGVDIYLDKMLTGTGEPLLRGFTECSGRISDIVLPQNKKITSHYLKYAGKKRGLSAWFFRTLAKILMRQNQIEYYGGSFAESVRICGDVDLFFRQAKAFIEKSVEAGEKPWENQEGFVRQIAYFVSEHASDVIPEDDSDDVPVGLPDRPLMKDMASNCPTISFDSLWSEEKKWIPSSMDRYWEMRQQCGIECGWSVSFDGMGENDLALWSSIGSLRLMPDFKKVTRLHEDELAKASPALRAVNEFLKKYENLEEEYKACIDLINKELLVVSKVLCEPNYPEVSHPKIEVVHSYRGRPSPTNGPFRKIARIQPPASPCSSGA
jgi:hypothetical protein